MFYFFVLQKKKKKGGGKKGKRKKVCNADIFTETSQILMHQGTMQEAGNSSMICDMYDNKN